MSCIALYDAVGFSTHAAHLVNRESTQVLNHLLSLWRGEERLHARAA